MTSFRDTARWLAPILVLAGASLALLRLGAPERPPAPPPPATPIPAHRILMEVLRTRDLEGLARRGREVAGRRASLILAAAALDNPLGWRGEDLCTLKDGLRILEAETSYAVWSRLRLARLLPLPPRSAMPPGLEDIPPGLAGRAALALARRLDPEAAGTLAPEALSHNGPPDSSGRLPSLAEILLAGELEVRESRLPAARRREAAAELDRLGRALDRSEEQWKLVLEQVAGAPRADRAEAEGRKLLEVLGVGASENDLASHATILLEPRCPGLDPAGLPLGHPADHLLACRLCQGLYGPRVAPYLASLGVGPEDFRTPEARLSLFRGLQGRPREEVVMLFGPPALEEPGAWTWFPDGHRATVFLGAAGRVESVRVEPAPDP